MEMNFSKKKKMFESFEDEVESNDSEILVEVVWEHRPLKCIAKLKVYPFETVRSMHEALVEAKPNLADRSFVYKCQGKPLFREFWDVFEAQDLCDSGEKENTTPRLILQGGIYEVVHMEKPKVLEVEIIHVSRARSKRRTQHQLGHRSISLESVSRNQVRSYHRPNRYDRPDSKRKKVESQLLEKKNISDSIKSPRFSADRNQESVEKLIQKFDKIQSPISEEEIKKNQIHDEKIQTPISEEIIKIEVAEAKPETENSPASSSKEIVSTNSQSGRQTQVENSRQSEIFVEPKVPPSSYDKGSNTVIGVQVCDDKQSRRDSEASGDLVYVNFRVIATENFVPESEVQLAFDEGDVLEVMICQPNNNRWFAQTRDQRKGWIPAKSVRILDSEESLERINENPEDKYEEPIKAEEEEPNHHETEQIAEETEETPNDSIVQKTLANLEFDSSEILEENHQISERSDLVSSAASVAQSVPQFNSATQEQHVETPVVISGFALFKAMHNFHAKTENQLSLSKYDIIELIMQPAESKWAFARKLDDPSRKGWVPRNYIKEVSDVSIHSERPEKKLTRIRSGIVASSSKEIASASEEITKNYSEENLTDNPQVPESIHSGGAVTSESGHGNKKKNYLQIPAIAIYSYNARREDQLTFAKGDHLEILLQPSGKKWWFAKMNKKKGWIPHNYVQITSTETSHSIPQIIITSPEKSD